MARKKALSESKLRKGLLIRLGTPRPLNHEIKVMQGLIFLYYGELLRKRHRIFLDLVLDLLLSYDTFQKH